MNNIQTSQRRYLLFVAWGHFFLPRKKRVRLHCISGTHQKKNSYKFARKKSRETTHQRYAKAVHLVFLVFERTRNIHPRIIYRLNSFPSYDSIGHTFQKKYMFFFLVISCRLMYMQMFFSLEITITPQRDKEIVPPKR